MVQYLDSNTHSGKTKSQSPTKTPCNQPAIAILRHAQTQHRRSTQQSRHQHWHCKGGIKTFLAVRVHLTPCGSSYVLFFVYYS